jgi:DNA-binding response OmpR family regulator
MRLLLAESDHPLALFVSRRLEAENYAVEVAADGLEAQALAAQNSYQLLILDLNMTKVNGMEVLAAIRANKEDLPILALSDQLRIEDRVKVLDSGADDCLTKPFSLLELAARVRALLRRGRLAAKPLLAVADLELNRLEHVVRRGGRVIDLTPKEFLLLEYLMQNAGRPASRAQILERVWRHTTESLTNVVDVYVNYLRKKVDEPFQSQLIRTVRGRGYQLGGREFLLPAQTGGKEAAVAALLSERESSLAGPRARIEQSSEIQRPVAHTSFAGSGGPTG